MELIDGGKDDLTQIKSVFLVIGYPCAGKTTLSKKLASHLKARHISMGDLIRKYFANKDQQNAIHYEAFKGMNVFEADLLADLLRKELVNVLEDKVVIDAGPPFHEVSELLNLNITKVLCIHTSRSTREERFLMRVQNSTRSDDKNELFIARTKVYQNELIKVYNFFNERKLVIDIEGDCSEQMVLYQALSSLLSLNVLGFDLPLYTVEFYPKEHDDWRKIAGQLRQVTQNSGYPSGWMNQVENLQSNTQHTNHMVLLLKPGLIYKSTLFGKVVQKILDCEYKIQALVYWDAASLKKTGLAKAHFDTHYLYAKWGKHIIPQLSELKGKEIVTGYDLAEKYGLLHTSKVWDEGESRRKKVTHSLWGLDMGSYYFINGHMPELIAEYENSPTGVYAFHIMTKSPIKRSWSFMRDKFLGATDPKRAQIGSLRWNAANSGLDIDSEVCMRNNAFHLSSGPFEGFRELMLWFGNSYAEKFLPTNYRLMTVDRPWMGYQNRNDSTYICTQNMNSNEMQIMNIINYMEVKFNVGEH